MRRGGSAFLAGWTQAVKIKTVIGQFITKAFADFGLSALNDFILEFGYLAAFDTNHMVVMVATVEFEHRVATLEMMAFHEAGSLELCQYPINGRKPDFLAFIEQDFVDFFRGHVPV